jgi:Na+-driven multidrug efflux pump
MIGARGQTAELATEFMQIVLPSLPVLAQACAVRPVARRRRRKAGDVCDAWRRGLTAVLDPIFIFGFDLGIHGAAIATVISRFAAGRHRPLWADPRSTICRDAV